MRLLVACCLVLGQVSASIACQSYTTFDLSTYGSRTRIYSSGPVQLFLGEVVSVEPASGKDGWFDKIVTIDVLKQQDQRAIGTRVTALASFNNCNGRLLPAQQGTFGVYRTDGALYLATISSGFEFFAAGN